MQDSNIELMENLPVSKAILKLSIPTVLSTIISLLYNLTDTFFVGLLDDPIQLGAISLAFPAFLVIQAVGNIFGNGAPSYISRRLGAKDYEEVKRTSSVSVYLSFFITIVMTILYFLFRQPILSLIGTSPDTVGATESYLNVIVGFSAVLALQVVLPAILRAEGKIKESVTGMVIGTVINIVLDPLLILVMGQGIAGAAWATIIGNAVAVIYYIVVFLKGNTVMSISFHDFKVSSRILGEVLKIGLPASIAQIVMSFSNIIFNNLASGYGDYIISAYGVAGRLISMVFMILVGYVSGYMPFAGYNYGAGNMKRVLSALKFTILTSTIICIILLIPFLWLAPGFISVFSSNSEIIDIGVRFLNAQAWAVPFMGIQLTLMCTFQATGSAIRAMVINLGRQCLFYIPLLFLFNSLWQVQGLLYVQMVSDVLTTLVAILIGIPLLSQISRLSRQKEFVQPVQTVQSSL